MNASLETTRRLRAWNEGKPLPRGQVVNTYIGDDDDAFIVAFLRMGGESRPWGVAYGTASTGPTILTVPEGRNRQLVGDMMATFAPALLEHFRHPAYSEETPASYSTDSLRQLWLPGPTHLEMLHFIAAAYARTKWDRPDIETLRALGNLANCLFIESQRPGQQIVQTATNALQKSFIFPASPIRQAHLGSLLAWLTGGRTRDTRLKASRSAEKLSVATVLDPEVERQRIQKHLEAWGDARKENNEKAMAKESAAIHSVLKEELTTRWNLVRESLETLRNDKRKQNPGLKDLCTDSAKQFYFGWGEKAMNEDAGDNPYWPNVFTDYNARSAGYAYQLRMAHDQKARHFLVHGDKELQKEELAAGHGVLAKVRAVATDTPQWKVTFSYPELPTLKPGDKLCIAGSPKSVLEVEDVDLEARTLMLRPKWTNQKRDAGIFGMAPTNPKWRNMDLVLIDEMPFGIDERRATMTRQAKKNGDDITDLIIPRPRRHSALDDDGVVDIAGAEQ